MKASINGQLFDLDAARIDPCDRGFTLGDGLYETIAVRRGYPRRLDQHLTRLRHGADVLGIPVLKTNKQIGEMIGAVIAANEAEDGVVRLTLTRGPGARGIVPPAIPTPTLVITAVAGSPPTDGVRVITASSIRRNEHSPVCSIKSVNALDSILARREAEAAGVDDAILLNTAGNVAESTVGNVFLLVDGGLVTPPAADGALPGIMRAEVIRLARAEERTITTDMLARAAEVFLTNALGIRPVVGVNGQPVGEGEPGLITQMLAVRL